MRNIKRFLIGLAALAAVFSAASCQKDDTVQYNNVTMGNVVNGVFVSDQGNTFHVTEQSCTGKLDTMKRALIICDILENVAGKDDEYNIRLNYMASVLTKDIVPMESIADFAAYANDPVILSDWWISGGYINLCVTVPVKYNSKVVHELNFVHELKDGAHKFYLRHNANGEMLKEGEGTAGFGFASAYASFPISSVIPEEKADISVEHRSYKVEGSYVTTQTETRTFEIKYERNKYEHVPLAPASSVSAYSVE